MLKFLTIATSLALLSGPLANDIAFAQKTEAMAESSGLFLRPGDAVFFAIVDGQPANVRKAKAGEGAAE